MSRCKFLAVSVASLALVLGTGSIGIDSASAACSANVAAQIAAQNATISYLQSLKVGADARTNLVLDAQIAARQAAVADLQASC